MIICRSGFFYYNETIDIFQHTHIYSGDSIGMYEEGIDYKKYRVYKRNIKLISED